MIRSVAAALSALAFFPASAQNRVSDPSAPSLPFPLGWPVVIDQDTFLKKFCLYDSKIYSKESYICVGTNQALMCVAGEPASWSLNPSASWCK
jgi:hypothetical protein